MAFHGESCGLHARRAADELEAVDDLLRARVVVDVPVEVALHVATARRATASGCGRGRASGEADLERDGDVALDLLGAPAVGLGDDLDHRRHRVRVGLDVELLVAVEPEAEDAGRQQAGRRRASGAPRERRVGSSWVLARCTVAAPGVCVSQSSGTA